MSAPTAKIRELRRPWAVAVIACFVGAMLIPGAVIAQPMPGSIKTTDATCADVNAKHYAEKTDVYLDGSGLPDGDYYVRIESPTGTNLGQSATASVAVVGGEIVGCVQIWAHVQYADTDNPGGNYKVLISKDPTFPAADSKSDTFKVGPVTDADLDIEKGVSLDPAGPFTPTLTTVVGVTVYYRITITNTGTEPLSAVSLVDDRSSLAGCTIPATLAAGASYACDYSATATAGTVTNTATADSAQTTPVTDSATVTAAAPAPAMTVSKGVSLSAAGPFTDSVTTTVGTTVYFRITIENTGNVALSGITLVDSAGALGTCTVPTTLAVGASYTCDYSRTAVLGTTVNTATADSTQTAAVTDSATVIGNAAPAPAMTVTKGVSLSAAGPFTPTLATLVGVTVYYRITITNTGNVVLTGVTLTDSLSTLAGCTIPTTLAVGASYTCDYSRTAVLGTTTNTATADSTQTAPVTDTAEVTARTAPAPAMTVTKGVSLSAAGPFTPTLATTVGTTVYYRITITNTGNVALTGVTLTDSLSTLAGCTIPTTLAVGASYTCDYSRTAVLGTTPNTATADSAQTDPGSDQAQVTGTDAAPQVSTPSPPVATASPTIASPSPTGSVAAVTSPPTPSGEVAGVTARPEVTMPPTDSELLGGRTSGALSILLILAGISLLGLAIILHRPRPGSPVRESRNRR